jgi:6-phosphogluconolactonase
MLVYIGTYTGGKSRGIYRARFDTATGKLSSPELAATTKNPTFLALDTSGKVLYAVGETDTFKGQPTGAVSSYAIAPRSGELTLISEQPSRGSGPCHLAPGASSRCVLVANYGSGSIAALPVEPDGKLGDSAAFVQHNGSSVNSNRQAGPHAHFITMDPENRFALTCDLGLDKVLVYKLDPATPSLTLHTSAPIKPGAGPRHLAFYPHFPWSWAYVINEMGSTLTVFEWDSKTGSLKEIQTISSLPEDFRGHNTCAEVAVHPSGKFVYGSNRGHDSIAVFAVEKDGKLKPVQQESTQGKNPRHFAIDPTGKWLLAENQNSDSIVIFRLDPDTGRLKPTGDKVEVGSPVCLVFSPDV